MAFDAFEVAALLAIQPKYSDAIFAGKKYVEFRKRGFKQPVKLIVVYTSSPIKKIIGYFTIERIVQKNPKALWQEFGGVGSISEQDYFNYFRGKTKAFGIVIKKVETFKKPISLKRLGRNVVPPQSFRYITQTAFKNLGIGSLPAMA
jgi:predicted transcriptional regulator